MALSEREQQVLRDLEQQLHVEDPSLADTMEQAERDGSPDSGRFSPRHVGAGVALVLVGLAVVVGGVAVGHSVVSIVLGVAGFGIAVWGVTLMLTRVSSSGGSGSGGSSKAERRRSSFMDRQSERWDRRRDSER